MTLLLFTLDRKIKSWIFQIYEKDSIVEYKDKYYIALEERNYVEPDNLYANWLYVTYIVIYFRFYFPIQRKFSGAFCSSKEDLLLYS